MYFNIITIGISAVALIVSLHTAWRQNNIALFPQRHEVYKKFLELDALRAGLKVQPLPPIFPQSAEGWICMFSSLIMNKSTVKQGQQNDIPVELINIAREDDEALKRIPMLFRLNADEKRALKEITDTYSSFIGKLISCSPYIENDKDVFLKVLEKNYDIIIKCLEKQCHA